MNNAYAHAMQVQECKLNTGCYTVDVRTRRRREGRGPRQAAGSAGVLGVPGGRCAACPAVELARVREKHQELGRSCSKRHRRRQRPPTSVGTAAASDSTGSGRAGRCIGPRRHRGEKEETHRPSSHTAASTRAATRGEEASPAMKRKMEATKRGAQAAAGEKKREATMRGSRRRQRGGGDFFCAGDAGGEESRRRFGTEGERRGEERKGRIRRLLLKAEQSYGPGGRTVPGTWNRDL
jgi:hypothetical protein